MTRRPLYVAVALALALANTLLQADDFRLRDEARTHHTLRFAGTSARSLTIRAIEGSIRATGTTGNAVEVDVTRVVRADTRADLQQAAADVVLSTADGRPDVEAVVRDRNGSTCGERERRGGRDSDPDYRVEYTFDVRVPAGTRLVLCTVNAGAIDVTRTSGDFAVTNVNGRIAMTDVRGSGSATTVNGSLEASFVDAPRADAEFKTVNGSVVVSWPANLSADLRLKTLNGGLFTDFDVQPLPAAAAVRVRRGGRFVYRSDNTAAVRVGQGGPRLTLETVNGDIRVLRRNPAP